MGLFGSKKNTETKPKAAKVAKVEKAATSNAGPAVSAKGSAASENNRVILRPRITEKATLLADIKNVFVFEIADSATKHSVRKAVASMYGVTPMKVSIARNPAKEVFYRGKMGTTSGVKKAYVYLKKGDKIEIL